MRSKILISACLLGHRVRYDGKAKTVLHPVLDRWIAEGRVVSVCPEMAGGLGTPRLPAEIERGLSGKDVLGGRARVINSKGQDVTKAFVRGAQFSLRLAQENDCRMCVSRPSLDLAGLR